MTLAEGRTENRITERVVPGHSYLYSLKIHEEISYLALDGLQTQSFLLDERAIEIDRLSVSAVHPSFMSVKRHQVRACQSSRTIDVELLNGHVYIG